MQKMPLSVFQFLKKFSFKKTSDITKEVAEILTNIKLHTKTLLSAHMKNLIKCLVKVLELLKESK